MTGSKRKSLPLLAGGAALGGANLAYTKLPQQAKRVWDLQTGPNRQYAQRARAEARNKVSKARNPELYELRSRPTSRTERAKERTGNTMRGATSAGLLSGGLTAALNRRAGGLAATKAGLQMAGIGGGIGGALGAAQKTNQYKTTAHRVKKNYTRHRNGDGTFAGSMLNPPGGVVSDIGHKEDVSKALNLRPTLVKPPKMPSPQKPPKMPGIAKPPTVPKATTIPSTKVATPGKPRIRETGISKALLRPNMLARPRGFAERQAAAQRAARTRQVAKAERGEMLARQFGRDKQMRSTRSKGDRVLQRERFPRKVSKMGPDQSEVSIMGGLGNQRSTPVRRPKYKSSFRRVG